MASKLKINSSGNKINGFWIRNMLMLLIFVQIFASAAVFCSIAFVSENQYTSDKWYDIKNRNLYSEYLEFPESYENALYSFEDTQGNTYSIPFSFQIKTALSFFIIFLVFNAIIFVITKNRARNKTRKAIKPLIELANTASRISKMNFDAKKFTNLANTIDHLSPNSKLHIRNGEFKELETAINQLIDRMHGMYGQQVRFVSDASHELRTPIAVIQGYANMLDRWGKSDEKVLKESIDAIKNESANMKILVEQLLFLARSDAGRTNLTLTQVDIALMLREISEEYAMIDKKHNCILSINPDCTVNGDVAMIKQAVRILVDNAVKYSPENSEIILSCEKNNLDEIICSVQDKGIGIASKDLPLIYNRFFRSDPAREKKTGGTGLGLSLAKWIIDEHEGYFKVRSFEGVGTKISIVLPYSPLKEENEIE